MEELTLSVALHSYFGPSWQLDVRGKTLYWVKSLNGKVMIEKSKILTTEKIETFIREVCKLNVFDWEDHYLHCCMLDGATWSVDLQIYERRRQSRGTNGYPENWIQFCDAFCMLAEVDENLCKVMA